MIGKLHCLNKGRLALTGQSKLTFGNMGLYHPRLFDHQPEEALRLGHILADAIQRGEVTGEHYQAGCWVNVGTCADLQLAEQAAAEHGVARF